jgi:hypothetical protein
VLCALIVGSGYIGKGWVPRLLRLQRFCPWSTAEAGVVNPYRPSIPAAPLEESNLRLDPVLIVPYRALDDPILAWWLGILWVTCLSILVDELTLALGKLLNRRMLEQYAGEAKTK